METKALSSTGFKHEFSIQELYVLTRHWLSDISFFEIEIKYFQSRLTVNSWVNMAHISRVDLLKRQLNDIAFLRNNLMEKMQRYQQKLEALLDHPEKVNETSAALEHSRLGEEYEDFIRALRQVKYAFFTASANNVNTVEMA